MPKSRKQKNPPVIEPQVERRLRVERVARHKITKALRHPLEPDAELAARHKLSPSERLAPYFAQTPGVVLEYIERLEENCRRYLKEVIEKDRIIERIIDVRKRSRSGGRSGGRPRIDDQLVELIDDANARGPKLRKKAIDLDVAMKIRPEDPLSAVRMVSRARASLERGRAKRHKPQT